MQSKTTRRIAGVVLIVIVAMVAFNAFGATL
ncbi:hypothetical protein POI8812_02942 [Pontivivens insulae]|uniref:Uncharacterized protein n=1 Tax=Pontivivens insulae TaxID=1639689 RepID=A0A2R8AEG4_9RHOB|nr:hypothetical protein DFR53_2556 [Pontivivens insulae]SPF30602.1 hypothetical protein POI8812_02942 [Pontivivens insulae]